jgi:TolB-like protein/tRNA A-37 threonylcarbamoyl transferase component Bud32
MDGAKLGHFALLEKIGEGGMGRVYKARDTRLERFVAVKLLPEERLADPERRARFIQEAKAASALNHPNIITIHEIAEQDGQSLIVMELVEGKSLQELIPPNGMRPNEALRVAAQVADALTAAHVAGIVHRDLKPSNIMVDVNGRVKVLDFGLPKLSAPSTPGAADEQTRTLAMDRARTEAGMIVGSVPYMSPEQAKGSRLLDGRSDMFSFGAVLYEMLTGRAACARTGPVSVLAAILSEQPAPLRQQRPEVPAALERVVNRCLAKDPAARYASMAEVRTELEKSQSRHLPPAAWVAAAALLLLGAAAPWIWERATLWRAHRELPAQLQLVVLPFRNVGSDPSNQVLCEGLAETLSSTLTAMEQFHTSLLVTPASEARKFESVQQAHRNLGANLAITGSVQRDGGRIRLTANLVDARTGKQISSWVTAISDSQLSGLQDEATKHVAALLDLAMEPQEKALLAAGRTANTGAYELYLQARGYLLRYDQKDNVQKAIAALRRAISEDPRFALAFSSLSEAQLHKYGAHRDFADLEEARTLGLRATELDDRIASAHANLGLVYATTGAYDSAIEEYRKALNLDLVDSAGRRGLAEALLAQGKYAEAEKAYREAVQLRPNDWLTLTSFITPAAGTRLRVTRLLALWNCCRTIRSGSVILRRRTAHWGITIRRLRQFRGRSI